MIVIKNKNIHEKMKPYYETTIGGFKVESSANPNDLHKWRIGEGDIINEYKTAKKYAKILRERGNEIIIALTHLGLKKDKKLAKKVPEIDLIVGGHSHSFLYEVVYQKLKAEKRRRLFKAGKHARWAILLITTRN